ncbi:MULTISPECIES: hypothetical protein [Arthrobacter]|uniref:DUF6932 family protein n=1 Tax=Arthrobacter sp. A333 TaxID=3138416 RepID=UPI003138E160
MAMGEITEEARALDVFPAVDVERTKELYEQSDASCAGLQRSHVPRQISGGAPTLGRHTVSLSDVHRTYVQAPIYRDNSRRALLWNNFTSLVTQVRRITPAASVYIGGSFVSWKRKPDDIDCVFVLDKAFTRAITNEKHVRLLRSLGRGKNGSLFKYGIDSYTLDWEAIPITQPENNLHHRYLIHRGYWDDWLQRNSVKNEDPHPVHALPGHGYLEVMLDGYAVSL